MIYVLIVIPFLLILMDMPLWLTLSSVAVYLIGFTMQIGYTIQYSKEM
jgi:hypothetical protein